MSFEIKVARNSTSSFVIKYFLHLDQKCFVFYIEHPPDKEHVVEKIKMCFLSRTTLHWPGKNRKKVTGSFSNQKKKL